MAKSSDEKLAWVADRIAASRPPSTLERGFGQAISDLAEAVAALEAGSAGVFGLASFPAEPAAIRGLAAQARQALEAWRVKLEETHGAEGTATVATIAARHGVVLAGVKIASLAGAGRDDPRGDAALAALGAALAGGPAVTEALRASFDITDEGIARIEVVMPRGSAGGCWSHFGDLNPRPTVYETVALPLS